jgi:hypothetical protein
MGVLAPGSAYARPSAQLSEMYQCYKCEKRYKANQIRDLKTHIVDEHNIKNGLIEHLKIDRNDCSEVSVKEYRSDNI